MKSWNEKVMFRDLVEANETVQEYLTDEDIDEAFDLDHHTRNVERIFERVGLQ
jgi:adenylosuccinate lyase